MSGWSDQKRCFLDAPGHLLALGGPGSGKTHTALFKAQTEIRRGALKPGQKILFLSFARPTVARIIEKAAEVLTPSDLSHLEISTYHGFAWTILRSHAYLLNGKTTTSLLPPPEAAAHLTDFPEEERSTEMRRLFEDDGVLHFDLFAKLVGELFESCGKLADIFSDSYPILILDEFQDTNGDEWAMIQQIGRRSRLIALADPEQRIYEFRGADPRRLNDFLSRFGASTFDFSGENHRSGGTDIAAFGNDILSGANKTKKYRHVNVVTYGFRSGISPHFTAKTAVLHSLRRLKGLPDTSIAVLVPSKRLMLEFSSYLSSNQNGLPELKHDVAMDPEPPALASNIIAAVLAGGTSAEITSQILNGLYTHIRGRRGGRSTPQGELDLAGALSAFVSTGKINGAKRKRIISEVQRIALERHNMVLTGSPADDWLQCRDFFQNSSEQSLKQVAEDAKFLRLLHRGTPLRASLSELWRSQGSYLGAQEAVRSALAQEHFAAAKKNFRGIHLMTIHKSKGKEFDEVVIYDGLFQRIVRNNVDARGYAQSCLTLRVAVTRAIRFVSIVTPERDKCPLL